MPRTVSNTYAQVAQAQLCANHVQHIERLSSATCHAACHLARRDSSAIKLWQSWNRIYLSFILLAEPFNRWTITIPMRGRRHGKGCMHPVCATVTTLLWLFLLNFPLCLFPLSFSSNSIDMTSNCMATSCWTLLFIAIWDISCQSLLITSHSL